eukprot:scaffold482_cov247-Pinguiococcus_pyrenoidosus.AAC.39
MQDATLTDQNLCKGTLSTPSFDTTRSSSSRLQRALGLRHRDVVAEEAGDVRRHHAHELRGGDDTGAAEGSASR